MTPEQKKHNLRLGLILGSIAVVFFLGFMAKLVFFGRG
ncbi:MAG: cytochrome oxidase small assembly protein [Pseudomonadota bacterium]